MAVYTFKHAFVGKSGSAPGTASAHVNYISRKSATCYQEAVGIASKPRQTHANATWRFLKERENSIRRNGRVCDKFIIAVPLELRQEEAIGLLRRFGHKIGCRYDAEQERLLKAPFFFTLQDWGTHNPHAHFVFVDSDRESGERVFGTTKKGSTDRLRAAWEETANAELERLGYEARIDRRPQRVIDAELEALRDGPAIADGSPEVHTEGLPGKELGTPPDAPTFHLEESPPQEQAEADDHFVHVTEMVSEHLPTAEPDMADEETLRTIREGVEGSLREEATPEGEGQVVAGPAPFSVAGKVEQFTQLHDRLTELQDAQAKLRQLQAAYDEQKAAHRWHEAELTSAMNAATVREQDAALMDAELKNHQTRSGRLKGFSVLGWKVLGRKEAEQAQDGARNAAVVHSRAVREAESKRRATENVRQAANETSKKLQRYEAELAEQARYGTREQMLAAEKILQNSEQNALKGLSGAQVYEALQAGEINDQQALEACRALGESRYVEMIEETMELDEEREL